MSRPIHYLTICTFRYIHFSYTIDTIYFFIIFKVLIKNQNEKSNNLTLPKVEIEKTNPIKDDQSISERLKQIERLEEMIKKQKETIKVLKNN